MKASDSSVNVHIFQRPKRFDAVATEATKEDNLMCSEAFQHRILLNVPPSIEMDYDDEGLYECDCGDEFCTCFPPPPLKQQQQQPTQSSQQQHPQHMQSTTTACYTEHSNFGVTTVYTAPGLFEIHDFKGNGLRKIVSILEKILSIQEESSLSFNHDFFNHTDAMNLFTMPPDPIDSSENNNEDHDFFTSHESTNSFGETSQEELLQYESLLTLSKEDDLLLHHTLVTAAVSNADLVLSHTTMSAQQTSGVQTSSPHTSMHASSDHIPSHISSPHATTTAHTSPLISSTHATTTTAHTSPLISSTHATTTAHTSPLISPQTSVQHDTVLTSDYQCPVTEEEESEPLPVFPLQPTTLEMVPSSAVSNYSSLDESKGTNEKSPRKRPRNLRTKSADNLIESMSVTFKENLEDSCSSHSDDKSCTSSSNFQKESSSGHWDSKYKALCDYRDKFGNCVVPHTYDVNRSLVHWVKRQRYQYKLMMAGKQSAMSPERVQALESIGFIWDSQAASWYEHLGELKEFKSLHGHCNVPSLYTPNPQLATWVKGQRRQYRLFQENKPNNFSLERIQELESVGFEWQRRSYRQRRPSVTSSM